MYHRILVPVDGSRTANRGLEEAVELAKALHASVRIFHIVDESGLVMSSDIPGADMGDLMSRLAENGQAILRSALALAEQHGVHAEAGVFEKLSGPLADAILDDAKRWGADLIVMGTHGRSGFAHAFLGSDAETVLHRANVPVLMVRTPEP